jgi:tRNA(fMet)-specific endonuclease VapC
VTELLLDSNILSHMMRQPEGAISKRARSEQGRICTSIIVAAEIRYGLAKRPSEQLLHAAETIFASIPVLPLEAPAELRYSELRASIERAGTPISANDMWIAAHALALDCTLVTANERKFRRVPGLRVEIWLA